MEDSGKTKNRCKLQFFFYSYSFKTIRPKCVSGYSD